MDKSKYAIFWEGFRFVTAIAIMFSYGDWFGLNNLFTFSNYVILSYLSFSFLATIYFVAVDFKTTPKSNQLLIP